MATSTELKWRAVQKSGKQLQAAVTDTLSTFGNLNHYLAEYRTTCDTLVFTDFEFAYKKNVELLLWDAHSKVNNRYRKRLSYFRDGGGKKKVVEQRKLLRSYLEFIKASQRYYRGYIQSLELHFGGISELEAVALKLAVHSPPRHTSLAVSDHLRQRIFESCHQTLIRLGDLSRYRETEQVKKERNWSPAIGYYDLAGAIRPTSGTSQNQLAVIAIADCNHLRSTYHLYRALAVEEPHATAKSNLEIGFKKIIVAHEKGELISHSLSKETSESGKASVGWFMLLHAQCYKGIDFSEHDELENEVLSQLAIDLKERSLESTLQKIILVNIAAEYFAGVQLQASPDSEEIRQAYLFFLRLNVKTMFTLLQILQPELEVLISPDEDQGVELCRRRSEQITAVTRRVLPGLRQYSSWLSCNAGILAAQIGDNTLNVQIKELWKIYANTLTLLTATFSTSTLPVIDYLLEEDEDTIGFKPFEGENTFGRYFISDPPSETKVFKPRSHDETVKRQHPNLEMLGRVRELLTDGLRLAMGKTIPIELVDGTTTFAYREEGIPSEVMASPRGHHPTLSSTSIELGEIPVWNAVARDAASFVGDATSQSASVSISANQVMNEMVDNIVGSEATNDSECQGNLVDGSLFPAPPTPPSYSFDDSPNKTAGNDTNYGIMGTLTALEFLNERKSHSPQQPSQHETPKPLLPSIYNSVFAPTAEEVSSRPGTAKGLSSTRQSMHQTSNECTVQSSISSMQTPSSMFQENIPTSVKNNKYTSFGPQSNTARHPATFEQNGLFHGHNHGTTSYPSHLAHTDSFVP